MWDELGDRVWQEPRTLLIMLSLHGPRGKMEHKGLEQQFSHSEHQNHLKGLLKPTPLSPTCRVSDSTGPGWGLRMCPYNKLRSAADTAGPGTTHQEKAELSYRQPVTYCALGFYPLVHLILKISQ